LDFANTLLESDSSIQLFLNKAIQRVTMRAQPHPIRW